MEINMRHFRILRFIIFYFNFTDDFGLMRVSQMCQFVEHLERQLYNAYEGAASALPAPPKVCTDYYIELYMCAHTLE